jgi:sulfotransferase
VFLEKSRQTLQMQNHSTSQDFHFIMGMPCAGVPQLTALLQQNPSFRVARGSPLAALFNTAAEQLSANLMSGSGATDHHRTRVLRGLFSSFYADRVASNVVFDTNRAWATLMPEVLRVFPQAKFIACVRHMSWVMDSIERLYTANPEANAKLFKNAVESNSLVSRATALGREDGHVGAAWAAIREAFYGKHSGALLVIDYEMLQKNPKDVLTLAYNFLDVPEYTGHDLSVVHPLDAFDDALLDAKQPYDTVLTEEVFDQYSTKCFWHDDANSSASVISVRPAKAVQRIRLQA